MRLLSIALLLLTPLAAANTDEVLAKMDASASRFSSMMADLSRVSYTKVLDEKQAESGTVKIRKFSKELQVFMEVTKPDPKFMAFRARKAEIYLPRTKTIQEYDLGKQGHLVDQFLMIGFGATGRELRSNYDVKVVGEETISGVKAYKLQLLPKSAGLKEKLQSVFLWMDESATYPVQQQFIEPSGNYYLFTYSNIKLNPGLTEDALKLKAPKGTKREVMTR